ncbi:DUF1405 domain-containing protein [Paenibacillus sp. sgz500958]|uniref:DUF1405 domain-containing protein n=1 Tax=Paenibacillus sp. sgz500958 TaxID=3242475 RepID=UPI0036D2634A
MLGKWSEIILKQRAVLWLLFVINFLGTIYGYIWYGNQLEFTAANYPLWLLPLVPDSPTASLFFTVALLMMLYPPKSITGYTVRGVIEALAVITSVKYGVWAVSMIAAGGYQGDFVSWKDWMLIISHTGMAVEALLFARFFSCRKMLPLALLWTLFNDTVDYSYGVYPWLPSVLEDDVTSVQLFTFTLTLCSAAAAWLTVKRKKAD